MLLLSLPLHAQHVFHQVTTVPDKNRPQLKHMASESRNLTASLCARSRPGSEIVSGLLQLSDSREMSHAFTEAVFFCFFLHTGFSEWLHLHVFVVIDEMIQVESVLLWCLREFSAFAFLLVWSTNINGMNAFMLKKWFLSGIIESCNNVAAFAQLRIKKKIQIWNTVECYWPRNVRDMIYSAY